MSKQRLKLVWQDRDAHIKTCQCYASASLFAALLGVHVYTHDVAPGDVHQLDQAVHHGQVINEDIQRKRMSLTQYLLALPSDGTGV